MLKQKTNFTRFLKSGKRIQRWIESGHEKKSGPANPMPFT
ncbi:hypothetical protein SBDP1_1090019 [Syntrophobacter sp. SbD1]|nr:hypothetical protein SBDP1_1090019 [Syntrophobacter sp. SbD1]